MPRQTHPYWAVHTIVLALATTPRQVGSGTRYWQCRYCDGRFTSTITRVISHVSGLGGNGISGCQTVPRAVSDAVIREQAHLFRGRSTTRSEDRASQDEELLNPLPTQDAGPSRKRARVETIDVDCTPASSSAGTQATLPSRVHSRSWVKERQRIAEIEIARTLIECNISFNVLRCDQWKRMVTAIAAVGSCEGWTGLEYRKMRTTMLDEEKERIEVALQPIKTGWTSFGCTIISDGWSDIRRRHMINILVSSCLGTYFLRAVDAGRGGERITGEWIYRHIRQAIIEVGPENVVQVVTDNASNCKRMGEMVEEEFPSIVWTPCAAHCMDLMMEDIGRLPWVRPIIADATRITTFFRKKHQALAIFRHHSTLDMVRPSKTRFAYMYLVLERLHCVYDALRQTVVDSAWRDMHRVDTEPVRYVQRKVLDESWWIEVGALSLALKPMYVLLRATDMEGSTLGLLYHLFLKMKREIEACTTISADRYVIRFKCFTLIT